MDDDCDGVVDEDVVRTCGSTTGACTAGEERCEAGVWSPCTGGVEPGTEVCDGALDENCDGAVDEGCACTVGMTMSCGTDTGRCSRGLQACAGGSWGACTGAVDPVPETCNGMDDDCDGSTDEGLETTFYRDADGDGYGVATMTMDACTVPGGYAGRAGDCDDGCTTCHPGGTEICDSADNDCDGMTDEDAGPTWYRDADGDGFGDGATTTQACTMPAGYVAAGGDCDDSCPACRPGGTEVCNGHDDDCDGSIDDGSPCPCTWAERSGHAYLFCVSATNRATASSRCAMRGYSLVKITSAAEQSFAWAQASSLAVADWWIGLSDQRVEGTYEWEDGSALGAYDNWNPGEPNDSSGAEDCVEMQNWSGGRWNDASCGNGWLSYVCEAGL